MPTMSQGSGEFMGKKVKRTFMQVYQEQAMYSQQELNNIFLTLKSLGMDEVILQWTSYDDLNLYLFHSNNGRSVVTLPRIINAARLANIKLWLGTHFNSGFWGDLLLDDNILKFKLDERIKEMDKRLSPLISTVDFVDEYHETVIGWYISDEIDDENWNSEFRENLLIHYLSNLSLLLKQKVSHWPITISGFTNGEQKTPQQLRKYWERILLRTNISKLLFQDGIGAEKLDFDQLGQYLEELKRITDIEPGNFGIITELFESNEVNGKTVFNAASSERINRQIEISYSHSTDLTIFSAPTYLLNHQIKNSTKLFNKWSNSTINANVNSNR